MYNCFYEIVVIHCKNLNAWFCNKLFDRVTAFYQNSIEFLTTKFCFFFCFFACITCDHYKFWCFFMAREFGCRPEDIHCAIGPNIGQCCFETDADVPHAMIAALGKDAMPYIKRKNDKYFLDLKAINALFLKRRGVRHIDISDECTACRTDRFWSHRRVGLRRGSQGAIIQCKEV